MRAGTLRESNIRRIAGRTSSPAGGRERRRAMLGQHEEIVALRRRQAEGTAQALENLFRRVHIAALLEPGVPGGAQAGEGGDVFAPQTPSSDAAAPGRGRPGRAWCVPGNS